jgi:poly-gamma-glutamate synthesis protein (capsule biosynthesis protein)
MEETLSLLEGDGIRHVGAGMNHADADRMTSVECRGRRFAFLGFASQAVHMNLVTAGRNRAGCAPIPSADRLAARIGQLRGQADAVVLSLHHGQEYFRFPSPAQVDLARTAARAGANVVLGHHPHALQGLEHSAGSVIAHSIGNFFLPSVRSVGGRRLARRLDREYVILKVRFFGRGDLQVQVLGGRLRRDGRLVPCDDREQHSLHWRIQRLSDPLRLDDYALFWQQYRVRRRRILAAWSLLDALIRAVESPLAAGRGG